MLSAALALAVGACAGPGRRVPPEPALRIWAPGIVHWSRDRVFSLEIENTTARTVRVEAPDSRRARVVLFAGPGPDRVCGQDGDAAGPAAAPVALEPGDARVVRVDLGGACGRIPPGEYRYEVGYDAPAVGPGPSVRLRVAYGHVVVDPGPAPALDGGGLGSGRGGR